MFKFSAFIFVAFAALSTAFVGRGLAPRSKSFALADKIKITENVQFDTIAREWRLKWSADNDKSSLSSVQQTLEVFMPALKKIEGVKSVQRIVCGGCLDYKVRSCGRLTFEHYFSTYFQSRGI